MTFAYNRRSSLRSDFDFALTFHASGTFAYYSPRYTSRRSRLPILFIHRIFAAISEG